MHIFLSIIAIFGAVIMFFPSPVLAGDAMLDKLNRIAAGLGLRTVEPANAQGFLGDYIGIVLASLLAFLGVIFMLLTIYAGFLWMTAKGNDDQVRKAQKILQTTIIGLVIIALAYGIMRLLESILGGLFKE